MLRAKADFVLNVEIHKRSTDLKFSSQFHSSCVHEKVIRGLDYEYPTRSLLTVQN